MEYLNDILLAEVHQQIEIMHELRQLEIRLALGLQSGLEKTRFFLKKTQLSGFFFF
jgi:hypothetical protein